MARDPLLPQKIRDAVVTVLQALKLPGVKPANVLAKLVEEENVQGRPCLLVTSQGLQEQSLPGTTESQDVILPFALVFLDTMTAILDANDPLYRQWRKAAADALAPPAGKAALKALVPQVYRTEVSMTGVQYKPPAYLLATSSLSLKVWAREPQ